MKLVGKQEMKIRKMNKDNNNTLINELSIFDMLYMNQLTKI